MPPGDLKLSVFQTKNLSEKNIWDIGERHVAQPRKKTLYGRGDVTVASVQKIGLKIDPDNEPPRHAGIIGWPEGKSEQKSLAQELAEQASLRLKSK